MGSSQQQHLLRLSQTSSPSPRGNTRVDDQAPSPPSSSSSETPSLFDVDDQASDSSSDSSDTTVVGEGDRDEIYATPTVPETAEESAQSYGFRVPSGSTMPVVRVQTDSPALPDPNGLGWPAKSTLSRLNSTPEERKQREDKLADAVRTLLECIGEDPERDGLRRTPERYAKALMWLTRGYEERLAGEFIALCLF